jgi:RimJ/RimL family protein N-acetyltransferase
MMNDADHLLLIILHEGRDIGVLRFDRDTPATAVISIYLIPEMIGRGLGVAAIQHGCDRAFKAWNISEVHAYTRSDNGPAIRAFEKAGFARRYADPNGDSLLGWTLQRGDAS